jgi:RNA polymerase sigma-70 factor (ECF subfamily)
MKAPYEDAADLLIRMDNYHRLYAALDKLSAIQRRRLVKRFLDGLTYREIADNENVSHKTVEESVTKALKKLKKLLCTDC